MKNMYPPEFMQELKAKNDIVEVIGSYIKLERRGYTYWACCPFHHEKTPSFAVNAGDGYYHCFGCGVSGDVIGFIKGYENVDFRQAVEILAARAGLQVPAYDDKAAEESARRKKKLDRLHLLMRDTARFYLSNLYSGQAQAHLAYTAKRGLSPTVMKKFGLGASLDFGSLPEFLLGRGYTREECLESGACSESNGRMYDSLAGRLIVPIIDQMDEVIAFGGRLLEKSDRAKYKNTRETVLFNKSRTLFNLNQVKKLRRAGGLNSLIMVEGYMDAISLAQAGFPNVVASMGTSLTKDQARLCKRYADDVFISYDGDFAGQKANLRGLDIMKQEGLKVRVVPLPDGLDPDDVIQKQGAAAYQACLDHAMPLIDFRIHAAKSKYDLSRSDERRDYVRDALQIVREAESATEREQLLRRISEEADVSVGALQRDLEASPKPAAPQESEPSRKEDGAAGDRKAERFILAACLFDKPYARDCDLSGIRFSCEELTAIADFIERGRREGHIRPSGLFDEMSAEGELSEVLDLDLGDTLEGERAARYFADSLRLLKERGIRSEIAAYRSRFETAASIDEKREMLSRINALTKKLGLLK